MSIVLYHTPFTNSTSVHWALAELGIPYQIHAVNLYAGEQRKPAFLALNPNGKVPVLVDGETPLFESLAILIHLGQTYGVPKKLWSTLGTPAHMKALSWLTWGTVTLGATTVRYYRNTHEHFPAEMRIASHAHAAQQEWEHHVDLLEQHLAQNPYMGGDAFTLVDVSIASVLAIAERWGLHVGTRPHVKAWVASCWQRAARQKAWPA